MAEYAKKKNDELAALCKERSLPHTGKKADLVKRLEEYDATHDAAPAQTAATNDDEIDFDDEPAPETATTEAAANAMAAGGVGEVKNPQAVPNQHAAIDPAKTDDLTVDPPAEQQPEAKEEKDFSTGLAERTLDEEIEKRKARLRRFGVSEDSEEWKALERAQKFGNAEILGGLNIALSAEKKRGRGPPVDNDGGIRKRSKGRPGPKKVTSERPRKEKEGGGGGGAYPSWMTQADRDAADRRKAKFAA